MEFHHLLKTITPPILYRIFRKAIKSAKRSWVERHLAGQTKLHLASGSHVFDDWANIDLESTAHVIGWDLTDRLPVRSDTIELIYCEHFIEHITLKQATALLQDCHRVLRPGGILRLSTPNLKILVDEYLAGRTSEWGDVGWHPSTPCQLLNEGFRLWGHQFLYDAQELKRLFEETGYRNVIQVAWGESATPALRNLERRPFHGEIIFEATKQTT